jgi:restriction system protein
MRGQLPEIAGQRRMWMVRAGRGGRHFADFLEQGIVALGWSRLGDPFSMQNRDDMAHAFRVGYPDWTETQSNVAAQQMWRFLHEFEVGDGVLTYDSQRRRYLVGEIVGPPVHRPDADEEKSVYRAVSWGETIGREDLSAESRNTLGAIQTLFLLPDYSCIEIERRLAGREASAPALPAAEPGEGSERLSDFDPFGAIQERALERLKDRLYRLEWGQMQEIVAALLRALGYRTTISPQGTDRGKDIFASPDGLGFEQPRIVVEVKHRRGQAIGAPEVRSFLGGRHKDDRGLYVSTGGFTREAYYEAERASIPVTLMTLDELAHAIMENYEKFDLIGRSLIPLTKVYWPV